MRAEVRGSKAQLRKRDPRRLFRGGHFLAALTLPKALGKSETKTTMEGHFCFPNCTGSQKVFTPRVDGRGCSLQGEERGSLPKF